MHLFNPWHDLALANFAANYTPPASAVKMAEDLALLPLWYGEGDAVIAEGEINRSFVNGIKEMLPVASKLISFNEIALHPHEKIMPWGWDPALCKKTAESGCCGGAYSNYGGAVQIAGVRKPEKCSTAVV